MFNNKFIVLFAIIFIYCFMELLLFIMFFYGTGTLISTLFEKKGLFVILLILIISFLNIIIYIFCLILVINYNEISLIIITLLLLFPLILYSINNNHSLIYIFEWNEINHLISTQKLNNLNLNIYGN